MAHAFLNKWICRFPYGFRTSCRFPYGFRNSHFHIRVARCASNDYVLSVGCMSWGGDGGAWQMVLVWVSLNILKFNRIENEFRGSQSNESVACIFMLFPVLHWKPNLLTGIQRLQALTQKCCEFCQLLV